MVDQRLDISCDRNIRPPKTRFSAGVTDHLGCFLTALNVAITDNDLRPFASKRERRRSPDSRSSASYQFNLSSNSFMMSILKIVRSADNRIFELLLHSMLGRRYCGGRWRSI